MKKEGSTSLGIIASLISTVVSFGVAFFLTPILINSIGKEAYSFYPIANNFVSYMSLATMALNSMAARFVSVEGARGNFTRSQKYYSSVLIANVCMSFALFVPMALIVAFIDVILNVPGNLLTDVRILFALTFFSMIINLISSVFDISTFTSRRMDVRACKDIACNALRAALFIGLFVIMTPHVYYFGVVSVFVALFGLVVQWLYSKQLMPGYRISLKNFDWRMVKKLVSSGVWNSVNNLGSVLLQGLSLVMVNMLIGPTQAGDYSLAQNLPHVITAIITAVYNVLLPKLTYSYAVYEKKDFIEAVKRSQVVLGSISIVPVCLVMAMGQPFYDLWVPGQDSSMLQSLTILLAMPLVVHGSMWTIYGLNIVNDSVKVPALVLLVLGMCSALASIISIVVFGLGIYAIPAITCISSVIFYGYFIPLYAAREIGARPYEFLPCIVKSGVFSLAFTAAIWCFVQSIELNTWLLFFAFATCSGVLGLVLYTIALCGLSCFTEIVKRCFTQIGLRMKRAFKCIRF